MKHYGKGKGLVAQIERVERREAKVFTCDHCRDEHFQTHRFRVMVYGVGAKHCGTYWTCCQGCAETMAQGEGATIREPMWDTTDMVYVSAIIGEVLQVLQLRPELVRVVCETLSTIADEKTADVWSCDPDGDGAEILYSFAHGEWLDDAGEKSEPPYNVTVN